MSFKEAISQRIISDYKIPTIAVSDERVARVIKENRILNLRLRDLDEAEARAVATGVALKRVEKQGVTALMLMIWSSRARNRSPDPVVSCFFGRIAPSDAATESCFSIRGNRENEIASFHGLRHGNLAISSQQSRQKTTLAQ